MKALKAICFALSMGMFLSVSLLWLLETRSASATCPDPECSEACHHVCVWDYNPQSTTAFGTDKKSFSQDMVFEWCLTCPYPNGYADFDGSHPDNVNVVTDPPPVAYPDFFNVSTCSGSITINISGKLIDACPTEGIGALPMREAMDVLHERGDYVEYAQGEPYLPLEEGVLTAAEEAGPQRIRMYYLYPADFPRVFELKRVRAQEADLALRKVVAIVNENVPR